MIIATTIEDAHLYGDIIPSMYRLRYRGFKERQNYSVPHYNGMEYDAYDTPATTYLIWRDEQNVVRGCARLSPTTLPYMIADIWPHALGSKELPRAPAIWEASRMCIDKSLPPEQRRKVHGEILCALQEIGQINKIDWMIGVMSPPIWRSVFTSAKWPIEFLSHVIELDTKERIVVGRMRVSVDILADVRQHFSMTGSVLASYQNISKKAA